MGSTQDDLTRGRKGKHRGSHRPATPREWGEINPLLIRAVISAVAKTGGALRFGYTRDQGAYAVGIYGEYQPYTEYFHDVSDCDEFLRSLLLDYGDDSELTAIMNYKA